MIISTPMHRVLRPLRSPVEAAGQREESTECVPQKDPLEEFGARLAKRGFVVEKIGMEEIIADLSSQHELRELAVRPEIASTTDDPDQVPMTRFVGRNFFRLWSPAMFEKERDKFSRRQKSFPGSEKDMDLVLSALVPNSLAVRPGHVSVDQLPSISTVALNWGLGQRESKDETGKISAEDWVQDVIAFYLSQSMEVSPSEKLKLASKTGNELLLVSTLHNQCGKVEAIEEIVENAQVYDEITGGPKANLVMKKMLQHQTKCGSIGYSEELKDAYSSLLKETKEKFGEVLDFRDAGWLEKWVGERDRSVIHNVCLSVEGSILYPSTWCLSSWSPFFYRMLYGSFAEGNVATTTVSLDEDVSRETDGNGVSLKGASLFLNLLHPTRIWALWYLLPSEVAQWHQDPILQDLFEILFEKNLDVLMEVFQLAHKFQVQSLVEFCVLMVEVNSEFGLADRILLADAYHLPQMMARCLAKMTTARGVKRILQERPSLLDDLSCSAHKLITERLLDLV